MYENHKKVRHYWAPICLWPVVLSVVNPTLAKWPYLSANSRSYSIKFKENNIISQPPSYLQDMFLFGLSNEVWKLESRLEMFKKQLEIKNTEMEKVNDRVSFQN